MFKEIIVGVDGSDTSKTAIGIACDLAKHYDGTVTLVHVPHAESAAFVVGAMAGYHAATLKPTLSEIEQAGRQILDNASEIAAGTGCKAVKTHLAHGDAVTEILACADKTGADLIVTGRRGLNAVSSLLLGSTTQRINHSAKCACLSVA
ncbi:universal stress protein [Sulfitobacter sp. SK012]|uniref:universal stress protein n=1 Tax=Sulfitobacter sp. SK012 TaxID=1389005 RepID=UPI0013B412CB|nr:universal stress protein [Sulfitobacter sp. SK012]